MYTKLIVTLPLLALLTACGAGLTGSTSFQTLSVLGNGDGIARGTSDDGSATLFYSPGINEVVNSANASQSSSVSNIKASDFPITSQSGNVRIRSGTMTDGSITMNITGVEDIGTTDAAAVFIQMPSGYRDLSMVTGTPYTHVAAGSYTYNGTQMTTSSRSIAPGSTGSFSLVADFGQGTFGYSGRSGNVNVSGSGVLDTVNGRFATSGLSVTSGSSSYGGTMHGLMHGSGATATSGIFHTSGSSPAYTGAFVGSK